MKIYLTAILMALWVSIGYSQIQLNSIGRVGIGGIEPESTLHLKAPGSCLIKFKNGNNATWGIGNYTNSPWSAQNAFAIVTGAGYPRMEFREEYTYIHDRLIVGVGYAGDEPTLQINDNAWMKFKAFSGATGLLFHETGTNTYSTVQYGARIYYNANIDGLILETKQNNTSNTGLYIQRQYGLVGINKTNPSYRLDVNGSIRASGTVTWSDTRLKKNVTKFRDKNKVNGLKKLETISYIAQWPETEIENFQSGENDTIPEEIKERQNSRKERIQYGFDAEELKKYFPELVSEDDEGYLGVDYVSMIPLLIELYKAQEDVINQLEKEIGKLKGLKNATLTRNIEMEGTTETPYIAQNVPNPFNEKTEIEYYVPESTENAEIYFYDMNGVQLKSITLYQRGNGQVTIDAGEFKAGMYMYTLIADRQVVDTKRMILTD